MASNEDGGEEAKKIEPLESLPTNNTRINQGVMQTSHTISSTDTTSTNVTATSNTTHNIPSPITNNNNVQQHTVAGANNNILSSVVQGPRTDLPNGEPLYESYFEDSFVNELEACTEEDVDDIIPDEIDEACQDEGLHPSTLEFDFDSFGPESFIFTPGPRYSSMRKKVLPNRDLLSQEPITPTTNEPPTLPLSQELEQAENRENQDTTELHDDNPQQETNPAKSYSPESQIMKTEISDEVEDTKHKEQNQIIDNNNDEKKSVEIEVDDPEKVLTSVMPDSKTNGSTMAPSNTKPSLKVKSDSPTENYYNPNDSQWRDSYPVGNNGSVKQIDLKVIEPYKKVISHAGYCHHHNPALQSLSPVEGEPAPAIIVFSACYLPDRSRRDYSYVMDHLFLYVLTSLHELVADDYILIYLHNSRPQENNLPTFGCLKRCYHMIDRRLRKNLKALYLVQPTFWLKTIVVMCKPFISSKFSRKLRFIESIEDLKQYLPIDQLVLPQSTSSI